MKPNFLVIGAPRSGTTWISRSIMQHPGVFVPRAKEIHYFDTHYSQGRDFYEEKFHPTAGELAIGEVTPDYFATEECPSRIRHDLGDIKLIVSLRNPVDRLYSRYWNTEGKFTKRTGKTFEERIEDVPSWVTEGFYDIHLERYLSYFSQANILVLLYDELEVSPAEFLRKIFRFLEVDEDFVPDTVAHKMNAAGAKPWNAKSKLVYATHRLARRLQFNRLSSKIDQFNQKVLPQMNADTRTRLIEDVYGAHINRLEQILDIDLQDWRV